jgi:hypothetical protein
VTTISTPLPAVTNRNLMPLALTVVGATLAGNGLLLGTQLFLDSRDYSQVATGGLHLAHYVVWTACLVALSQLYPRLGALRGATGSRLPEAVLVLAGVGAALDGCTRFVSAFVTPYLADRQPGLVDSAPDPILLVPLLASGVVAMVGTAALGVSGWRRDIFPRPAAAMLVVGGVAIPVLGPVSTVLLGASLVWVGTAVRKRA